MSSAEETPTLSLPSLAIVAVLGYLVYRYFFGASNATGTPNGRNGLTFTAAQVDQVAQMFPQLSRRDIMWDLHRNRGSVQATVERIMSGRSLDPAPPSFQPAILTSTTTFSSTTSPSPVSRKTEPDLITRYNLQAKINSKGKEKEAEPASGWAATKDARQQMLQRRRDEMILAARRRIQEKDEMSSGASHLPGLSTMRPS